MIAVVIRQPFTCASCGGKFLDRHTCPTVPSLTGPVTSPPVTTYPVDVQTGPAVTVNGNLITRPVRP